MVRRNLYLFILCSILISSFSIAVLGMDTLLPYERDTIRGKVFYRYPVEKSIGLYRISVNFGVSQEEIIKYNPEIKTTGLRYGETVLLIPVKDSFGREKEVSDVRVPVHKSDSVISVGNRSLVKDKIIGKSTQLKRDTVILSLSTDTASEVDLAIDAPYMGEPKTRHIGVLLPLVHTVSELNNKENIFLEFYYGLLLCAKQTANENYKIHLHVFDIGRGQQTLDSLFLNATLDTLDAIIGPVYTNQVGLMTSWSKAHKIPVFIPFEDDIPEIINLPYIYQFNMSEDLKIKTYIQYLRKNKDSLHCTFVYSRDIPQQPFTDKLKRAVYKEMISYNEVSTDQILHDSLRYFLEVNRRNIIVFHSDKYRSVQVLMEAIKKNSGLFDITILGEFSWLEHDIELPMLYCTVFSGGKRKALSRYDESYFRYFGRIPKTKTLRYDLFGYDLMSSVLGVLDGIKHSPLQSNIRYVKKGESGGYINKNVRIKIKK